ncbi:BrnT family toxin [Kalamiella sp. sgz302252]|uniref:BrnT family toxin n=1 Tax=Pantoea sp. sgz302252 TaxID=3341827 RepID=UPI0036D3CBE9
MAYTERFIHNGWQYEWNKDKLAANLEKHGVHSELACEVFSDPNLLSVKDASAWYGEIRHRHLGEVWLDETTALLVVVTTERNDATRIISARLAEPREIRWYRK